MLGIFRNLTIGIVLTCLTFLTLPAQCAFSAVDCEDANTYCIETISDLQAVTDNLEKNCYLMNDIETDATETALFNDNAGFLPIGVTYDATANAGAGAYVSTPFTGTFNGNGFTLSGLVINATGTGLPAGLFGTVTAGATDVAIRDLILDNITVNGDNSLGALAGSLEGSATVGINLTVRGCRAEGDESSVTSAGSPIGGLFGSVSSATEDSLITIRDCSSNIPVSGLSRVGGLVGAITGNVALSKCSHTGDIIAVESYAGGLVADIKALLFDAGTGPNTGAITPVIENCFSRGSVSANDYAAGFAVTNEGDIRYSYCTGHVAIEASPGTFGAFTPDIPIDPSVETVIDQEFTENYFNASLYLADYGVEGYSPEGATGLTTASMQTKAGYFEDESTDKTWDFNSIWAIEETEGHKTYPFFCFQSGEDGTIDDPIKVRNIYDLQAMGAASLFESHFILVSDVDASMTETWNGGKGFSPIGRDTAFEGSLSGQGHIISNLFINRSSTINVGLFASLETSAVIDGVHMGNASVSGDGDCGILAGQSQATLTDCSVSGKVSGSSNIGGLAGELSSGVMENCSSSVEVISFSVSGGMVGLVSGASTIINCHSNATVYCHGISGGFVGRLLDNATLSACSSKGSVYGYNLVGGMIGYSESTTAQINDCVSSAYMEGSKSVGGFVGQASSFFQRCLSSGSIKGTYCTGGFAGQMFGTATDCMTTVDIRGDYRSGGFAGSTLPHGMLTRCYSKGTVSGTEQTGGLIGLSGTGDQSVQNSYWDSDASGMTASDGGMGLSSDAMMQSASFTGWDIGAPGSSVWGIVEGVTRPYLHLSMTVTDLALALSSPVTRIEDGGTVTLDLTVTNKGGQAIDNLSLQPSFNTLISETQYSTDGGETWQELSGEIALNETLEVGMSKSIQIQGIAHGSNDDTAQADCHVDYKGIDLDLSNNSASMAWTIGPEHVEQPDDGDDQTDGAGDDQTNDDAEAPPVIYGGDGGGCFIRAMGGM